MRKYRNGSICCNCNLSLYISFVLFSVQYFYHHRLQKLYVFALVVNLLAILLRFHIEIEHYCQQFFLFIELAILLFHQRRRSLPQVWLIFWKCYLYIRLSSLSPCHPIIQKINYKLFKSSSKTRKYKIISKKHLFLWQKSISYQIRNKKIHAYK